MIAKGFFDLELDDIEELLKDKIHEIRLVALLILVENFNKSDEYRKKKLYNFYLDNIERVNNWDLVDLSADKIIGNYLFEKEKSLLYELAKSDNLWERRIAIISTFTFIKKNQ